MGKGRQSGFGKAYLAAIPLTGLALLGWSLSEVATNPPPPGWLILTGLTALTGAYTVRIPGSVVRLSVSEPIVFLATLLYGPSAGTITAAVDALVMSLLVFSDLFVAIFVGGIGRHMVEAHHRGDEAGVTRIASSMFSTEFA